MYTKVLRYRPQPELRKNRMLEKDDTKQEENNISVGESKKRPKKKTNNEDDLFNDLAEASLEFTPLRVYS
ncbi:hypothetical protein FQR65_LT13784 [Abscondita terminalis]|nr:hypothetical protein FQR65_LT13784 [Abscondita terminalis]